MSSLCSVLSSNYVYNIIMYIIKALTQFKLCDIANMSAAGYRLEQIMLAKHNCVTKALQHTVLATVYVTGSGKTGFIYK